jgi:hypothetical protein
VKWLFELFKTTILSATNFPHTEQIQERLKSFKGGEGALIEAASPVGRRPRICWPVVGDRRKPATGLYKFGLRRKGIERIAAIAPTYPILKTHRNLKISREKKEDSLTYHSKYTGCGYILKQ